MTHCFASPRRTPSSVVCLPDPSATHFGAGGARNWAMSVKISLNISRDTATSAITQLPRLTTFAPILNSFSGRLASDHGSAVFGIARA